MSRQDLTDEEKQLMADLRRGVQVARMPDSPRTSSSAAMYRQRIPTGPIKPPVAPPRRVDPRGSTADRMERVPTAPVRPPYVPSYSTMDYRLEGALLNELAAGMPLAPAGPAGGMPGLGGATGGGGGGGGSYRGGGGGSGMPRKDIEDAIKAMQEAATGAQNKIGGFYSAADEQLARMAGEYAASQEALRAGGARTLGAFGVQGGMLDPMAQSAGDYLTATRGTLAGLSADQQARLEAQKAAYALILGDLLK